MTFEDKLEVSLNDISFLFILIEMMCEITLYKREEGLQGVGLSRVHEDFLTNIFIKYQEGDPLTDKQINRAKLSILFYKSQIEQYLESNSFLKKLFNKTFKKAKNVTN